MLTRVTGVLFQAPAGSQVEIAAESQSNNGVEDVSSSSDNMDQRKKDKSDGRDRTDAEVVDTYPKGDRDQRRTKEQKAINDRGGVDNLDNRRNEVAPSKWTDMGIAPPP